MVKAGVEISPRVTKAPSLLERSHTSTTRPPLLTTVTLPTAHPACRIQPRDAVDLHFDFRQGTTHRCSCRRILCEELLEDFIHSVKILQVSQEDYEPHDAAQGHASSFQ